MRALLLTLFSTLEELSDLATDLRPQEGGPAFVAVAGAALSALRRLGVEEEWQGGQGGQGGGEEKGHK